MVEYDTHLTLRTSILLFAKGFSINKLMELNAIG